MVSASGTLFVLNDATPEGNETHIVEIISVFGGAIAGSPSTLELTIVASDEPYGRVQFSQVTKHFPYNQMQDYRHYKI